MNMMVAAMIELPISGKRVRCSGASREDQLAVARQLEGASDRQTCHPLT